MKQCGYTCFALPNKCGLMPTSCPLPPGRRNQCRCCKMAPQDPAVLAGSPCGYRVESNHSGRNLGLKRAYHSPDFLQPAHEHRSAMIFHINCGRCGFKTCAQIHFLLHKASTLAGRPSSCQAPHGETSSPRTPRHQTSRFPSLSIDAFGRTIGCDIIPY